MRLHRGLYFYQSPQNLDFSGEINANTVIVGTDSLIIVDPGLERQMSSLKDLMAMDGVDYSKLGLVILTHSHPDHLEAASLIQKELGIPILLSRPELEFLKGPEGQGFYRGLFRYPDLGKLLGLSFGPLRFGGLSLDLIHAPGHSPGSQCLFWPEEGLLITGDLYFPGTIGGFHLPGGSPGTLYRSIQEIYDLPGVRTVLCGHGPVISGPETVEENYQALFKEIGEKKSQGIL
jgi:glyoxylase-like metal-dependent hydrolase (beta-lactamase superfamily II)